MISEAILPKGVRLYRLTAERAVTLWDTLKGYDVLWPDSARGDLVGWVQYCMAPTTLFLEGEDGKSFYTLSQIKEGLSARVHAVFYDHKLAPRAPLVRELLTWAMFEFDLYRLEAMVPDFSRALRRFLQRDLHFRLEGVMRDTFWWKGSLHDTVMLSILREEVI